MDQRDTLQTRLKKAGITSFVVRLTGDTAGSSLVFGAEAPLDEWREVDSTRKETLRVSSFGANFLR